MEMNDWDDYNNPLRKHSVWEVPIAFVVVAVFIFLAVAVHDFIMGFVK